LICCSAGALVCASAARFDPVQAIMGNTSGYFVVGKIVGAHGVLGELKVTPQTDNPERFRPGAELLLESDDGLLPVKVASARPHKGMVLIKLASVSDRTAAQQLQWRKLFIPESEAMVLGENENYAHDLIGLRVETITGEALGELIEILFTPANDVYVISGPDQQLLLPAIRDVVLGIDLEAGTMVVKVPDGLRDSISSA
jgi:16S rRNA processing protein RimM